MQTLSNASTRGRQPSSSEAPSNVNTPTQEISSIGAPQLQYIQVSAVEREAIDRVSCTNTNVFIHDYMSYSWSA